MTSKKEATKSTTCPCEYGICDECNCQGKFEPIKK